MVTIWAGLAIGAIYVLVAVGFNIVHVASGTFNFAQPQYLMLGTFIGFAVVVTFQLPVLVAIIVGSAVGFAVGLVEEWVAVRPLAGSGVHGELVTTVGWSVIMQGAVLLIWDADPHRIPGPGSDEVHDVLGGRLTITDMVLVGAAIVIAIGTDLWFRRTRLGLASLATSEDGPAAMLRGIHTHRLSTGAFAVAGALLAAIGPIAGPKTFAIFTLGTVLVLKAFVVMAVGGFGSFVGAMLAGFLIGVVEATVARYWGTSFVNIVLFALLVGVLVLRPQGLFGQRRERVV